MNTKEIKRQEISAQLQNACNDLSWEIMRHINKEIDKMYLLYEDYKEVCELEGFHQEDDVCINILKSLTDVSSYNIKTEVSKVTLNQSIDISSSSDSHSMNPFGYLFMNIDDESNARFLKAYTKSQIDRPLYDNCFKFIMAAIDQCKHEIRPSRVNDYKYFICASDYVSVNELRITDKGYEIVIALGKEVVIYNNETSQITYCKLDDFFGELNGRQLTEEDVTFFEMAQGYKPVFYNLEQKLK